jgi:hypothetical protein
MTGSVLSFRQRSHFASTRNLCVIPTEKLFCFDEEFLCFRKEEILQSPKRLFQNDRQRFVIPTEKLFLLRRGIFVFSIERDSSVAKSSFRMTGSILSFRRRSLFASTRNLCVIPTEKLKPKSEC